MMEPRFQIDPAVRRQIRVFSSNYALYADMSNRFRAVIHQFFDCVEPYESFVLADGFRGWDLTAYSLGMRERIMQWVGLRVCVGIGPTKTLAKFANHLAKKQERFGGVCHLGEMSDQDIRALMAQTEVSDVWGIGPRLTMKLDQLGIRIALELRYTNAGRIREQFDVTVEKTVLELQGTSCLEPEEMAPAREHVMVSRSFGRPV